MFIEYHLPFDITLAYIYFFRFMPSIVFTYDKKEENNKDRFSKLYFELIMLMYVKRVDESYLSIFVILTWIIYYFILNSYK